MKGEIRNNKKKIKVRKLWGINPKTKVKESGKIYSRSKNKNKLKDILKEFLQNRTE
jgi:hypothetical protein